ncbi:MAG TPA: 7-carboxy-7-deazaguanine synthase QueE [Chthoniobacteraceae bacterium]|jgi:7-carboxy-7-deazaguanine synthase
MRISEIFYSIQGEGELTGIPSVFVRTSGCNLRCTWCDTKYASWAPEGSDVSIDEILVEVQKHPAGHVVLTGGEPMIAKGLPELACRLRAAGKHITIETAGTVTPQDVACDLASISPKLSNSTPQPGEIATEWVERHEAARRQPDTLREWVNKYPFQFKFVISRAEDLPEIEALLAELGRPILPRKVLLMPEGTDAEAITRHSQAVVKICKEKGYRYCDRLHIALFGHARGT